MAIRFNQFEKPSINENHLPEVFYATFFGMQWLLEWKKQILNIDFSFEYLFATEEDAPWWKGFTLFEAYKNDYSDYDDIKPDYDIHYELVICNFMVRLWIITESEYESFIEMDEAEAKEQEAKILKKQQNEREAQEFIDEAPEMNRIINSINEPVNQIVIQQLKEEKCS